MASATEQRALLEALDEPSMAIQGSQVLMANRAARDLFGRSLDGSDVRLVLRHPHGLEQILARREGDVAISGIGGLGRPWTMSVRRTGPDSLLVRLIDSSAARAAEKMRVDFVANASHELRTPLATILGYSETIADTEDLEPEVSARFGGIIRSEAKRMLRIVEDLMSLSRIEADRFVPTREMVPIGELVRSAAESARPFAESRGCTVRTEIEDGLPLIPGDSGQLLQVLDNLLINGLRYGCTRAACDVTASARRLGESIVILVADSGEGIPPEHLPRLTERFYRVDAARSRDAGGTGLGLAIVKHIVERHRGSLNIRSRLGLGTEVEVRLPLR